MTFTEAKSPPDIAVEAGLEAQDFGRSSVAITTPNEASKQARPHNWPKSSHRTAHRYGSAHRAMRAKLLAGEPHCRICAKSGRRSPASVADHVISLKRWPFQSAWGLSAYQPLCQQCDRKKRSTEGGQAHSRKTAAMRFLKAFTSNGGRVL
jgi:5-methylcytosine-specific restriction enzyme A